MTFVVGDISDAPLLQVESPMRLMKDFSALALQDAAPESTCEGV